MQSMWARYREETSQTKFIEVEHGFISYSLLPECIYLEDIWIAPEHRKSGLGLELVEQAEVIGRAEGKPFSLAVVNLENPVAATSLKAHLAVGFLPFSAEGNKIWLKRSIAQGV